MAIMLTLLIPLPSFATILLQKQEPESHMIHGNMPKEPTETGLDTGGCYSRIYTYHFITVGTMKGKAQNSALPAGGKQLYESRQHEHHREPRYVPV